MDGVELGGMFAFSSRIIGGHFLASQMSCSIVGGPGNLLKMSFIWKVQIYKVQINRAVDISQ